MLVAQKVRLGGKRVLVTVRGFALITFVLFSWRETGACRVRGSTCGPSRRRLPDPTTNPPRPGCDQAPRGPYLPGPDRTLHNPHMSLSVLNMWRLLVAGSIFFPGLFLLCKLLLKRAPFNQWGEADAVIVSARLVSSIQATMASSAGYIIASSCKDIMEDQHWLASAYILFAVPYFVYDIYAMFLCHWYKTQVKGHEATPLSAAIGYLHREFLMVLHHVFMVLVCFPVSVFWRQGKGDYFQGVMFLAELSTPSVCLGKILIQYKQQHTLLHKVNGVLMLVTFFICRVLLFPYLYYAYSRYASVPLYLVPLLVPWQCNTGAFLLMAPQVYWFCLISRGAFRLFTRALQHTHTHSHTHAHTPPANGYKPPHTLTLTHTYTHCELSTGVTDQGKKE